MAEAPDARGSAATSAAGGVYGPELVTLLDQEKQIKASLEQRGLAVITTSGALVSLLVALAALLLGKQESSVGSTARACVVSAVVAFVLASVVALLVNSPAQYRSFSTGDLDRMLRQWDHDQDDARYLVGEAHIGFLKVSMRKNRRKARLLQTAISLEVLGVGLVAFAVIATL